MVGVDVDGVDQVFDEHPSLFLVGFVPDGVDVDAGEELGDLLESLGEFAAGLGLFGVFVMGGLEGADQGGEASFFLLEGVRGDLVLVVQVEEPLTLPFQARDRGCCVFVRCRVEVAVQFGSDRRTKLLIFSQQGQAEDGSSLQTSGRASGQVASLASMLAAVDGLGSVVVLDAEHTLAFSAAHPPRQQVTASPPAWQVASMSGGELSRRDERRVDAGVPVGLVLDLAEVGAIVEDLTDGGVLDAGLFLDAPVREAVRTKGEDAADHRGHLVGFQGAVDHSVARRRTVEPPARSHSFLDGSAYGDESHPG